MGERVQSFDTFDPEKDIIFGKSKGSSSHSAQKRFHQVINKFVNNCINANPQFFSENSVRDENWIKSIRNELDKQIPGYRLMMSSKKGSREKFVLLNERDSDTKIWSRIVCRKCFLKKNLNKQSNTSNKNSQKSSNSNYERSELLLKSGKRAIKKGFFN